MEKDDIFASSDEDERSGSAGKLNKDNPFSFKRFLQNPDLLGAGAALASEEVDERSQNGAEAGAGAGAEAEAGVDSNPFSFKKWIKSSDVNHAAKPIVSQFANDAASTRSATNLQTEFSKSKRTDDSASHVVPRKAPVRTDLNILPDFSEDPTLLLPDKSEPDLTISSKQRGSKSDLVASGKRAFRNDAESSETERFGDIPIASNSNITASDTGSNSLSELEATILRLRQELAFERRRSEKFASKLSAFEAKERSETNALETAIAQIEERLTDATRRCDTAESRVVQLERDNAALRQRVATLTGLPNRDELVRRRCEHAANGLLAAASEGESVLKALLHGVDKLRLCAHVVNDVYRFEEEPHEATSAPH